MVKDVVFRATGEKAITKADKRADRLQKNQKEQSLQRVPKKNISKKDADVLRRAKIHKRHAKLFDQREEMTQNATLQKFNEGKMSKLSFQEKRSVLLKQLEEQKRESKGAGHGEDGANEDWEDVDEHEKEVYATTGYFDCPDTEAHISKADELLLQKMENNDGGNAEKKDGANVNSGERTLADIIMQKLASGDYIDGDKLEKQSKMSDLQGAAGLDQKVVVAYRKVGVVMRSYKSGKLPKAFKIIPQTQNWEELLMLTSPERWSAHSHFQATKIFSSQLNEKLAQRYFNLILLPAVQSNILQYKKLNYHLYMAVKKAMFKIKAFNKGFLLPLAEEASTREAIIIGSILQKMSINVFDVAAALIKMTTYDYKLGNGYFIKVLLTKRYALPTQALDELVDYFCKTGMQKFGQEGEDEDDYGDEGDHQVGEMPVMWHQTVLALVQCYKTHFSVQQRKKINALIKVQDHYAITPEIRRELSRCIPESVRQKADQEMK